MFWSLFEVETHPKDVPRLLFESDLVISFCNTKLFSWRCRGCSGKCGLKGWNPSTRHCILNTIYYINKTETQISIWSFWRTGSTNGATYYVLYEQLWSTALDLARMKASPWFYVSWSWWKIQKGKFWFNKKNEAPIELPFSVWIVNHKQNSRALKKCFCASVELVSDVSRLKSVSSQVTTTTTTTAIITMTDGLTSVVVASSRAGSWKIACGSTNLSLTFDVIQHQRCSHGLLSGWDCRKIGIYCDMISYHDIVYTNILNNVHVNVCRQR